MDESVAEVSVWESVLSKVGRNIVSWISLGLSGSLAEIVVSAWNGGSGSVAATGVSVSGIGVSSVGSVWVVSAVVSAIEVLWVGFSLGITLLHGVGGAWDWEPGDVLAIGSVWDVCCVRVDGTVSVSGVWVSTVKVLWVSLSRNGGNDSGENNLKCNIW